MVAIRFITHNIRHDRERFPGEAPWPERHASLAAHFGYHTRFVPNAIVCLQEPLHNQVQDILQSFNATEDLWQYIGVGRNDGVSAGEHAPIFFKPTVFECVAWDTVWLSPEKMQRGWDAADIRVVTVALLRHRESGRQFVLGNVHLDNIGTEARREGAKKMVGVLNEWSSRYANAPIVVMGDFNSQPDGDAYQVVHAQYGDVKELCDTKLRYGEEITYTSFGGEEPAELIDFVFVGPQQANPWQVHGYAVLPTSFDHTKLIDSDHRAVVADLEL